MLEEEIKFIFHVNIGVCSDMGGVTNTSCCIEGGSTDKSELDRLKVRTRTGTWETLTPRASSRCDTNVPTGEELRPSDNVAVVSESRLALLVSLEKSLFAGFTLKVVTDESRASIEAYTSVRG